MVVLNFFEFFCYFFAIFYYALGRNETERQDLLSLFLGIFQSILALNEAILVFFNFFNFLAIFFEFYIRRRVGTERNGTIIFIFFVSHPPSTYGGLKWSHNGGFKFF